MNVVKTIFFLFEFVLVNDFIFWQRFCCVFNAHRSFFLHFTQWCESGYSWQKEWTKKKQRKRSRSILYAPFYWLREKVYRQNENLIEKRTTEVSQPRRMYKEEETRHSVHFLVDFFCSEKFATVREQWPFYVVFCFWGFFSVSIQFHTIQTIHTHTTSTFHCSMPTNELIMCKINFYRFGCQKENSFISIIFPMLRSVWYTTI